MNFAGNEVKQNQSKKMSLADMIKSAHFEGTRAKFRFAGDAKIYTFDEYIQELEKRSKKIINNGNAYFLSAWTFQGSGTVLTDRGTVVGVKKSR